MSDLIEFFDDYVGAFIENAKNQLSDVLLPRLKIKNPNRKEIKLLCSTFRTLGCFSALENDLEEKFFICLMQSSAAYLEYLKKAPEEDKSSAISEPFYDAICGGYWQCAKEIAQNSRMSYNPLFEYEEDFLLLNFLMKFFFLKADKDELTQIIKRHEELAGEEDQESRNICKAFLNGDYDLFEKNINSLLELRADQIDEKMERETLPEEEYYSYRFLLEGAALLKLAKKVGFKTGCDYYHIPDELLYDPGFRFNPDCWRDLNYVPVKAELNLKK